MEYILRTNTVSKKYTIIMLLIKYPFLLKKAKYMA